MWLSESGEKNLKRVWWNNDVKAVVRRKVLAASDE